MGNSPCLNGGSNNTSGLFLSDLDIKGRNRIYNHRIDMGAFECQNYAPDLTIIPDTSFYSLEQLEIHISYFYPFVEDLETQDSELVWTFKNTDNIMIDKIEDKILISNYSNFS